MKLSETFPIGISTWDVGSKRVLELGDVMPDYSHDAQAVEALHYSFEKGQNHIDTAMMYGRGHTEELVGQALRDWSRPRFFVASKLWQTHYRRVDVIPAVTAMLRRLKIDYLDLLYVQAPSADVPMYEYIGGMNDAVRVGLVRSLAVSNFDANQLEEAIHQSRAPIVANQVQFNLFHKQSIDEGMREVCRRHDVQVVAYHPVERRRVQEDATLQELALSYNLPPAQIALAWVVAKGVLPVVRAMSYAHIEENIAAASLKLKPEEIARLDRVPDLIN